jgi:hypothetical protein
VDGSIQKEVGWQHESQVGWPGGTIKGVVIIEEDDRVIWAHEKGGQYWTKSMYRFLSYGGVTSRRVHVVWSARISLKVRVFIWQMFNDKLQTTE